MNNQPKSKSKKKAKTCPKPKASRKSSPALKPKDTEKLTIRSNYLNALINPFDSPVIGVPHEPALSSMKVRQFARGTFSCQGTNGFGFITLKPVIANNNIAVNTSQALGTLTTISDTISATASVGVVLNGPFDATNYTANQAMGRIVAMGIRIRYIGAELYRGGIVISLEEPNHQTLVGADLDFLGKYDRARFLPVGREWIPVTWQPVSPDEYQYTDVSSTIYGGHACLVLAVQSPLSSPLPAVFEYEAVQIVENIGNLVRAKTPTVLDSKQNVVVNLASAITSESQNYTAGVAGTLISVLTPLALAYYRRSRRGAFISV